MENWHGLRPFCRFQMVRSAGWRWISLLPPRRRPVQLGLMPHEDRSARKAEKFPAAGDNRRCRIVRSSHSSVAAWGRDFRGKPEPEEIYVREGKPNRGTHDL